MARMPAKQLERAEQEAVVEWYRLQYPEGLLFAIPNGLARPNSGGCSLKSGLTPGMPDLMVAVPRGTYGGLFIEMKRPKSVYGKEGKASIVQMDMLQRLNRLGYMALIAYGFEDARRIIVSYMDLEKA